MSHLALLLAGVLLLVVLVTAFAILRPISRQARLTERVEQVRRSGAGSAAVARKVRMAHATSHPVRDLLVRLLRIPVDMPLARAMAPWLVFVTGLLVGGLAGVLLHLLLPGLIALPVAFACGVMTARAIFIWEGERYRERILRQMPDLIELVVSATRAGLPASEAFVWVSREAPSPTREEFVRVVNETMLGRSPEQALMNLHRRTGIAEYAIFAVALAVQMRSGGRLAETIENIAITIRQRIAIAARARALAAESRLSARVLTALPFIAGITMTLMHHDYLAPLMFDPRGQRLLAGSVVALLIGTLVMQRMIKGATNE